MPTASRTLEGFPPPTAPSEAAVQRQVLVALQGGLPPAPVRSGKGEGTRTALSGAPAGHVHGPISARLFQITPGKNQGRAASSVRATRNPV